MSETLSIEGLKQELQGLIDQLEAARRDVDRLRCSLQGSELSEDGLIDARAEYDRRLAVVEDLRYQVSRLEGQLDRCSYMSAWESAGAFSFRSRTAGSVGYEGGLHASINAKSYEEIEEALLAALTVVRSARKAQKRIDIEYVPVAEKVE